MARLAGISGFLERQPVGILLLIGAALVAVVGAVDYVTGYEVSLYIFYLGPVGLVARYARRGPAVLISIVSAGTWLLLDVLDHPYSHPLIPYWNAAVRLGFFIIVAELEQRVVRRTAELEAANAALQEEMSVRRRAEEELRQHRDRLEELVKGRTAELGTANEALRAERDGAQKYLDVAGVIVVVIDADQRVTHINRKGCEVLGCEEREIIGRNWYDTFIPERIRDEVKAVSARLMAGEIEPVEYFENPVLTKNGEERIIAWHNTVLYDEKGRITATLSSGEDITERKRAEEAVRRSEALHRTLVETLPQNIFLKDRDSVYVACNSNYARDLGISPAEIVGKTDYDFHSKQLAEKHRGDDKTVMDSGRTEEMEEGYIRGGRETFVHTVKTPVKDEEGNTVGVLGIFWDITEHKRVEEALAESERTLRAIFEGARDGILVADAESERFVVANEAVCRMLGYTHDEMLGLGVEDIHSPEDLPRVQEQMERQIKGEISLAAEIPMKRKDGSVFYADVNSTPLELGGRPCLIGIFRDITERRRAEEAVREANETRRAVVQSSPLAIVAVDRERKVASWNATAERMFGWSESEALGALNPIIPKSKLAEHEELQRRILAGEPVVSLETVRQTKEGSLLDVALTAGPSFNAEGQISGFIGMLADITDRKRAEEALRQTEEQLRQSQKMEAIGRLAGGVAHDFNNLLTAIMGYSQMALERLKEADPLRRSIEQIAKAGQRAAELTRQLLAFSRRQVLVPEIVDFNEIVSNVEGMLRRIIGEDIDLLTNLDPALYSVKADPGQIEQVIMNLAVNSRDAMPQGGKLTIETANVYLDEEYARRHIAVEPGHYVMLAVSDTGSGMDEETKRNIFEPFFTTKAEGTGLGLSTVYGIVKQSGGNIWVYSELGQGSTFRIYLPVTEEAAALVEPTRETTALQGSETVLVVEDEDMVRELACTALGMNGYTVLEARDGGEALLVCEKHEGKIDLMLTDVVMPQMSGRELADRLVPSHPEMKVLYMSGYTNNAIVHHGVLDAGISFVQKPFTPNVLLRKVREVLDAP